MCAAPLTKPLYGVTTTNEGAGPHGPAPSGLVLLLVRVAVLLHTDRCFDRLAWLNRHPEDVRGVRVLHLLGRQVVDVDGVREPHRRADRRVRRRDNLVGARRWRVGASLVEAH